MDFEVLHAGGQLARLQGKALEEEYDHDTRLPEQACSQRALIRPQTRENKGQEDGAEKRENKAVPAQEGGKEALKTDCLHKKWIVGASLQSNGPGRSGELDHQLEFHGGIFGQAGDGHGGPGMLPLFSENLCKEVAGAIDDLGTLFKPCDSIDIPTEE